MQIFTKHARVMNMECLIQLQYDKLGIKEHMQITDT